MTSEESQRIAVVAQILETGRAFYPAEPWTVKGARELAQGALREHGDGIPAPFVVNFLHYQSVQILSTTIPLGTVLFVYAKARITEVDVAAIKTGLGYNTLALHTG
jgi:hypothetical protein